MGWKQKVVFGTLLAVVTVGTLGGMAAVFGLLLSSEHPDIDTTLPPPTPDPLEGEEFLSDECPATPLPLTGSLPSVCLVTYPNGATENSRTYDFGRCSNRLCITQAGQCASGRCCCQRFSSANVTYECGDLWGMIATVGTCACQSCAELNVTFAVTVQDGTGIPVAMATILVDGEERGVTNANGFFGFLVSGLEESVRVSVRRQTYADFEETYAVMPGETNTVDITLQQVVMRTFTPPPTGFQIVVSSLEVISDNDTVTEAAPVQETVIEFPPDFLDTESEHTLESLPVDISSDADIEALNIPFTLTRSARKRRAGVARKRMVRQAANNPATVLVVLTVTSVGWLDISDELGVSVTVDSNSTLIVSAQFNRSEYTDEDLRLLNLYVFNQTSLALSLAEFSQSLLSDGGFIRVEFTVRNIVFPFISVMAFEEVTVCFAAVRAFDPSNNDNELTGISVQARTRQNENSVSVVEGETGTCIRTPCEGTLTLEIRSTLEFTPAVRTVADISSELQGAIYENGMLCNAMVTRPGRPMPDNYFTFNLFTTPPPPPPVPTQNNPSADRGPTSGPFCALSIRVSLCSGMRAVVTVESSELTRVVRVESSLSEEVGSGGPMCTNRTVICVEVRCRLQSNISVTQLPAAGNEEECVPVITGGTPQGFVAMGNMFVVQPITPVLAPGVFMNSVDGLAECRVGQGRGVAAIQFQCNLN